MLIGRDKEKQLLQNALSEEYSQFIAVYGRRRVGKTFLIREAYGYKFDFQFTGAAKLTARKQLVRFRRTLKEHGQKDTPELTNWGDAFSELKRFIINFPEGKKVIFLDELPWMDAPRSGFLSELESFWNDWASARKDIVFVVCDSGTGSIRAREFHPHPLTESCVKVSPHTALHTLCFVHMLLSSYPPLCLRVV